ncbi:hypothetical protein RIEGSTA812A_PEG_186 [invertebrate metagenome]|uniref:Uncharacterized protein n=1 Tax=invertebrate metagenome TaxID=1711999 RepID=A0A484H7Q8_9ZZZZ
MGNHVFAFPSQMAWRVTWTDTLPEKAAICVEKLSCQRAIARVVLS